MEDMLTLLADFDVDGVVDALHDMSRRERNLLALAVGHLEDIIREVQQQSGDFD